ncbi:glycosyltransferase family 4 protein [Vibrio sp. SCSIO 43136]|uniref:glycosyltransferase family 4 protein n=1 Tax=Vibrio sp. SCSIO 43136 TaxID=2819101 RepID=UPI0020758EDF|nr:glycosyltransferase family 4 protein [Vibrio sp. SCSIO 43136]USD67796.1 glycosyltransferase family 4 protein [Vibrio sp. SCSIO 43136]
MTSNSKNILFVHYGDPWLRGSEHCLLNLLKTLDKNQFNPVVWTNNPKLHQQVLQMGIVSQLDCFPLLLGWKAPRWNIAAWQRLKRQTRDLISAHRIDLIHNNSAAPGQWTNLVAKECGIPTVTQLHSAYPLRDRITLGLHLSTRIIAVSKAVAESMAFDHYPRPRLKVVTNGIDCQALLSQPPMDVRAHLNISKHAKVFVTVGSLIQRKGMDRLINAFRQVNRCIEAHLIIIGDGELKESLQQQANGLPVHFVGEQEHVHRWMRGGVDGFISGARSEAFGLVCAEASLAKLPVIAPNVGGIPEVVEHKHTGLLFSEQLELVQHIHAIAAKPDWAKHLGQAGHNKVLEQFTLEKNCCQIQAIYYNALNKPSEEPLYTALRPLSHRLLAR